MGGNLFTHAMSAAEVQAHEVWLMVRGETVNGERLEVRGETIND